MSKVHRLPDLRSVYPRSSGNNANLSNQDRAVLGEGETDTLAEVPALPHMKRRAGSRTLPPSRLAGQHYWGPLMSGATLRLSERELNRTEQKSSET